MGQHPVGAEFGGSTHLLAGKAIPCGYGGKNVLWGKIPVSLVWGWP